MIKAGSDAETTDFGIAGWDDAMFRDELFAAAIEACPIGISIRDATRPAFPLIYVNAAFTGMTGYFLHEVTGHGMDLLQGPDTDVETVERMVESLRINQPVDAEIQLYHKDGSPFWCELRVTPLSRQGRVVALIGVYNDITDRRCRQLEDQRRQRLQALGQLAGGVAHEINNLLQPILTYSELVQDEIVATQPAAAKRLDRVTACAEKARDIVRGILRFSRSETAALSALEMNAALGEAIDFVRGLLPTSVTVTVTGLDAELGTGWINAVELSQVFSNLLTNAAQAMNSRGSIAINAQLNSIGFSQAAHLGLPTGRYCVVTVTDTGPGMDETVLSHLFDPFFTTKPVGQGTGLGLSVVYGILQNWRGTITVKSAPGQGARFSLYIPLLDWADG